MFHLSQQYKIFVSDFIVPHEHIVSLIHRNTSAFPCCHETFLSILTYYFNVYSFYEIICLPYTCTILYLLYFLQSHNLFQGWRHPFFYHQVFKDFS